jgi:hypothetical protein
MPLPPAATVACLLSAITTLAACSPEVYQADVGHFAAGVTAASETFATLQDEDLQRQVAEVQEEIVARRAVAGLTDDCEELGLKLQKDSQCLAEWAAFRPGERAQPACPEVKGFYALPTDAGARCQLGIESGSGFVPALPQPRPAYPVLGQINRQLEAYAEGLAEITAAEDGQALKAALGDARDALVRLDERVGTASGRMPPAPGRGSGG